MPQGEGSSRLGISHQETREREQEYERLSESDNFLRLTLTLTSGSWPGSFYRLLNRQIFTLGIFSRLFRG